MSSLQGHCVFSDLVHLLVCLFQGHAEPGLEAVLYDWSTKYMLLHE